MATAVAAEAAAAPIQLIQALLMLEVLGAPVAFPVL